MKRLCIVQFFALASLAFAQGGRGLEGVWSGNGSYEGRFSDGDHQRYRARNVFSLQVSRVEGKIRGRLTMTSTLHNLDSGGRTVKEYDAEMLLRREGGRVFGEVVSARRRENNGDWAMLPQMEFSAKMTGPSRMDVEVIWERRPRGRVIDNDSFTLNRR